MASNPSMQGLWLLVLDHGSGTCNKRHLHLSFNASIKMVRSLCFTDNVRIDGILTCILNVVKYTHRLLYTLKLINIIQCVT